MRRDRGRHADGDAGRAVGEQVREGAGKHRRLLVLLIVGRAEIDGVLGDALEQLDRHLGHARFGVAHGGGVIAVDIAEIALPVDQRIAHREILREAHQRVVDRLVAMRMELAHHLADDAGAFGEALVGIEAQQPHRMHDAAVDRLQPVAHVGQRPVHDGRQRIGEIALFERLLQVDRFDVVAAVEFRRHRPFSHGVGLAEPLIRGKGNGIRFRKPSATAATSGSPAAARTRLKHVERANVPTGCLLRDFFDQCLRQRHFPVQFFADRRRCNDFKTSLREQAMQIHRSALRKLALSTIIARRCPSPRRMRSTPPPSATA